MTGEDLVPPFTCHAQDTIGLYHPIAPTAIRLRAPLPFTLPMVIDNINLTKRKNIRMVLFTFNGPK